MTGTRPAAARRKRPSWRAAFFALAGLGVVAGVAWALLGSRLFVVRSITVTGTHLVSPAQVIAAAGVPDGTSLIGVNPAQVARRVETIRQVASATVAKDWPDRLVITVRERVPVVSVRTVGGGYDLVDSAGVIVRRSTSQPAGLPLYMTSLPGSALRGDPGVAAAAAVLAELPPWLSRQVAGVAAAAPGAGTAGTAAAGTAGAGPGGLPQVTLYLLDHKTVLWGGTGRASEKDRELAILMRDPARYFDVSAPGTVVTR